MNTNKNDFKEKAQAGRIQYNEATLVGFVVFGYSLKALLRYNSNS